MANMEDMKGLIGNLKDQVTSDLENVKGQFGVLTFDLENVKGHICVFKDQVTSKEQLNALGDDLKNLIHYIKEEKSVGLLTRLLRGLLRRESASTDDAISGYKLHSTDCSAEGTSMRHPGPKSDVAEPLDFIISGLTDSSKAVAISVVGGQGSESFPKFRYVPGNVIYKKATPEAVSSGLWRDCLSRPSPCACAYETGGQFVYTAEGLLKEVLQDCPSERYMPGYCKGHLIHKQGRPNVLKGPVRNKIWGLCV